MQNLSSYDIVYGSKLPAISDLQLEGDDLTRPPFYRFTDYFDLLNEWIRALCDILKEHHNQTIEKRLQKHGSESPSLRSFNEGGIVYCHFPSKLLSLTTICHPKSSKCLMLGRCTFSQKHDKFLYLLVTIDGEVIEQMFHVSRLEQGLL